MAESLSGALSAPIQGKEILGPPDIARSLFRIAHEILERNHGTQDIVVLGIPSGFSIDPEGMVKLWMMKVRMRAMIATATTR